MVGVTNIKAAQTITPVLMGMSVKKELEKWIQIDNMYTRDTVVAGYKAERIENPFLQYILEEEMEEKLDDHGYLFSDDRKSYRTFSVED